VRHHPAWLLFPIAVYLALTPKPRLNCRLMAYWTGVCG